MSETDTKFLDRMAVSITVGAQPTEADLTRLLSLARRGAEAARLEARVKEREFNDTITIPSEVLEAGRRAFANAGTADDDRDPFAEACLAMLRSWPDITRKQPNEHVALFHSDPALILPLPKPSDGQ